MLFFMGYDHIVEGNALVTLSAVEAGVHDASTALSVTRGGGFCVWVTGE
jgi:hypothetical protein